MLDENQKAKVKAVLEKLQPVDEFCLDDLVQDTTDCIASNVNNQGIEGQVEYLIAQGVEPSHIFNVMGVPDEE